MARAPEEKEIILDISGEEESGDGGTGGNRVETLLAEAKEIGIRTVVSRTGFPPSEKFEGLAKVEVSDSPKGENSAAWLEIEGGKDVQAAIEASGGGYGLVIVQCRNWKIIPLENLIAEFRRRNRKLYAFMTEKSEIELAFNILEKGVDGIVIPAASLGVAKEMLESLKSQRTFPLASAKITKIVDLGLGERVCIDTTSQLSMGEGMLIGSMSNFFFLVHGETVPSEYIPTRPFRVNAGAIHSYALGADGKTRYLSEMQSGDRVQLVSSRGGSRSASIGRVKIERRPMILIAAKLESSQGSAVLQNAETIRLVRGDGSTVAVTDLKEGDEVLVHVASGAAGRHFGGEVDEFIIER